MAIAKRSWIFNHSQANIEYTASNAKTIGARKPIHISRTNQPMIIETKNDSSVAIWGSNNLCIRVCRHDLHRLLDVAGPHSCVIAFVELLSFELWSDMDQALVPAVAPAFILDFAELDAAPRTSGPRLTATGRRSGRGRPKGITGSHAVRKRLREVEAGHLAESLDSMQHSRRCYDAVTVPPASSTTLAARLGPADWVARTLFQQELLRAVDRRVPDSEAAADHARALVLQQAFDISADRASDNTVPILTNVEFMTSGFSTVCRMCFPFAL